MNGRSPDERQGAPDGGHAPAKNPGVYFRPMSQGIESNVDWTATSKPQGERVGPTLARRPISPDSTASEKRDVLDTLLGNHNLTASDVSGNDPYNATGRFFRR